MNISNKPWGVIDSSGNLVGKASAFPKSPGRGQRYSYRNIIAHNSGESPDKFVFGNHQYLPDSVCLAIYNPGSPRGEWHIDAWGETELSVLNALNATLVAIGLADQQS